MRVVVEDEEQDGDACARLKERLRLEARNDKTSSDFPSGSEHSSATAWRGLRARGVRDAAVTHGRR
jgi:hypothetical protein